MLLARRRWCEETANQKKKSKEITRWNRRVGSRKSVETVRIVFQDEEEKEEIKGDAASAQIDRLFLSSLFLLPFLPSCVYVRLRVCVMLFSFFSLPCSICSAAGQDHVVVYRVVLGSLAPWLTNWTRHVSPSVCVCTLLLSSSSCSCSFNQPVIYKYIPLSFSFALLLFSLFLCAAVMYSEDTRLLPDYEANIDIKSKGKDIREDSLVRRENKGRCHITWKRRRNC